MVNSDTRSKSKGIEELIPVSVDGFSRGERSQESIQPWPSKPCKAAQLSGKIGCLPANAPVYKHRASLG
jgi:hypothetical protein